MSSTGTFGINSDNFNISGNTNINNLVVSGTTSFPANSISSTSISGGTGGLTLSSDATDANKYIPFSSSTTGDISTANTSSNLYYNPSKTLFYSLGYGFVANYYQAQSFSATLAIGNNITSGSINIGNISTMSGTITIGSSLSNVNIAGTISGTISNATNATNASQVYQNIDTSSNTVYNILFSPALSAAGNNSIYQSGNAVSPLTYSPLTNTLNAIVSTASSSVTANSSGYSQQSLITGTNSSSTVQYIPFVNNANNATSNATGYAFKTSAGLSYVSSTGVLTVSGLTTTGNITLPTSASYTVTAYSASTSMGTGSGNIGHIISGAIQNNGMGITAITLSSISLPAGVWSIVASVSATQASGTITLSINLISTTAINKNICACGNAQTQSSVSISTILCVNASQTVNLNAVTSVNPTASTTLGQFFAVRIA